MDIKRPLREMLALLLAGLALLLGLALASFSPADPSFNHATNAAATNAIGIFGAYLADFLYQLFGLAAWMAPLFPLAVAGRIALDRSPWLGGWTSLLWLPFVLALAALVAAHPGLVYWYATYLPPLPTGPGGWLGQWLAASLTTPLHAIGRDVLLTVVFLASFVAASHISLLNLLARLRQGLSWTSTHLWSGFAVVYRRLQQRKQRFEVDGERRRRRQTPKRAPTSSPEVAKPEPVRVSQQARAQQQGELALKEPAAGGFKLPSLHLFNKRKDGYKTADSASLQAMARMLEKKLLDYRIEGEVVAVRPGPVVTQFEFEPAPGTKVSRIVALQDDLARAMAAVSVRVAGNIPGKSVVGIEIPNEKRATVYMYDVLASSEFANKRSLLPLALGVDIAGRPVVADLAQMPHLLIAGTTGSGKSVAINAMVCSLLMKHSPDTLRLIMVDPKMLELSTYEGIPHLLVPVVTDPQKAAKALAWAVYEMERRYRMMAEAKVRNIEGYNRAMPQQEEKGERLPYIVIVIDELADLMMAAGREVEQYICRLAQKARAAGIHLILATQRPSVDVITGLIKANLPSRISFQVSSRVDSRTILDQMGAEQLLGSGDMLFLSGGRHLMRVHGAYVSDGEVASLVEHLKAQGEPSYHEEVFAVPAGGAAQEEVEDEDPKYDEAVALVIDKGQASVSMVQRYLRIGYNRASRIVERMEREGLVTPPGAGGMRKVRGKSLAQGGGVRE